MLLAGYTPTVHQARIHESQARFKVISGAIKSGKSMSGAAEFCKRILWDIASGKCNANADRSRVFNRLARPRLLYWVVAPIHRLLKEPRAWVLQFIPEAMRAAPYFVNDDELWLKTPSGEGFVCIGFRSADNPHQLVSAAIDGMLLDEAARIDRAAWEQSLYTRLVQTRGWAVLNTSPFSGKGNWVYESLIAKADGDPEIDAFNLLARDNPAMPLDAIQSAKRHLPPKFYSRDFEGDWSTFGAQVFDGWDPKRHVVSEKQLRLEYGVGSSGDMRNIVKATHYGADWGYVDPTALVATIETKSDEFIVVDEHVASAMPFNRPGDQAGTIIHEAWTIKRRWGDGTWRCDHNPGYVQEFNNHGLHATSAYKDVDMGIRVLSTALHGDGQRPRLRILDTCKQVIKELGTLAWKLDANGTAIEGELDPKIPNDASDAVRYSLAHLKDRFFENDGIPRRPVRYGNPAVGTGLGWRRV